MSRKATIKFRSLRSNLIHLPLSLYAPLVQQQVRPQSILIHLTPTSPSSRSSKHNGHHFGWSGLASASSLSVSQLQGGSNGSGAGDTVEMDPDVAGEVGFREGDVVEIGIIYNPTRGKSISVTPLTSNDWEILELHANFLETNLLSQLRAAETSDKTRVNVWVAGKNKIQIVIDETNPPTKPGQAILVTPDTEVFVAPRPRAAAKPAKSESPATKTPNKPPPNDTPASKPLASIKQATSTAPPQNLTTTITTANSSLSTISLRTIPPHIFSQWPDTLSSLQTSIEQSNEAAQKGESSSSARRWILWASSRTIKRVGGKLDVKTRGEGDEMLVEVLPYTSSSSGQAKEQDKENLPEGSADQAVPKGRKVVLRRLEGIPDGHVFAWPEWRNDGDADAGWGLRDWQVIKLVAGDGEKERSSKRKQRSIVLPGELKRQSVARMEQEERLVGVDGILEKCSTYMRSLRRMKSKKAVLLTGSAGMGKTAITKQIATSLSIDPDLLLETVYVDCRSANIPGSLKGMREVIDGWMKDALRARTALLVLDNLDSVVKVEVEMGDNNQARATAEHVTTILGRLAAEGVFVIATAVDAAELHPLLSAMHVFGETISIKAMDSQARQLILREFVEKRSSISPPELDYSSLAQMAEGYTPADMRDLVDNAVQQMIVRVMGGGGAPVLSSADFEKAAAEYKPRSLRDVKLQTSQVAWTDIGGLKETRRILRETLEWPTKYGAIFANCPLRLRSGLLLYGYPGCGKTLLASAVAKECGLNFISVKGPELLNKYIGASEKSVRDIFTRAVAAKPCVLFFDEFDSIAPKRGHDSTGVTDRVVNQLLTAMDGAEGLDGVYVLAATSRPDLIDGALLRPGRLDKSLLCHVPDEAERLEILQAATRKLTITADLLSLAAQTPNYTGADLQALISNAQLEAIHNQIDDEPATTSASTSGSQSGSKGKLRIWKGSQEKILNASEMSELRRQVDPVLAAAGHGEEVAVKAVERAKQPVITDEHLRKALGETRPSLPLEERRRLERIYQAFTDGRAGMPDGQASTGVGQRVSLM